MGDTVDNKVGSLTDPMLIVGCSGWLAGWLLLTLFFYLFSKGVLH